jgi:hypothetical protein
MWWASSSGIFSSFNAPTARGVRPSPQTLSRPWTPFSNTTTLAPDRAAWIAVAAPAGPAPITAMSTRWELTAPTLPECGGKSTVERPKSPRAIRLRALLGGPAHPNPYTNVDGALEGVGIRRRRTMMEVMGTPPRTTDHGATLLEIYDHVRRGGVHLPPGALR